jgi:hypothetical protein
MHLVIRPTVKLAASTLSIGLLVILTALMTPVAGAAVPTPAQDPFYSYQGSTPLADSPPGTDLKTRTVSFHITGIPLPITAVQLLYRST